MTGVFTLGVEVFWIESYLGKHRETASVVAHAEILLKYSWLGAGLQRSPESTSSSESMRDFTHNC